jgi:hypothetical protein
MSDHKPVEQMTPEELMAELRSSNSYRAPDSIRDRVAFLEERVESLSRYLKVLTDITQQNATAIQAIDFRINTFAPRP